MARVFIRSAIFYYYFRYASLFSIPQSVWFFPIRFLPLCPNLPRIPAVVTFLVRPPD